MQVDLSQASCCHPQAGSVTIDNGAIDNRLRKGSVCRGAAWTHLTAPKLKRYKSTFDSLLNLKSADFAVLCDVVLLKYCAGGKIEKNEMGGACGANGGGERGVQGFGEEI